MEDQFKSEDEINSLQREYKICKQRGHTPSQIRIASFDTGSSWDICKFCGTRYRMVEKLEEEGAPM